MINAPSGMYTRISLDGVHPVNNALQLDSLRSAHLADIITTYRLYIDSVNIFHERLIKNRTDTCTIEKDNQILDQKSNENQWKKLFLSH